jgi:hypothetical protein
MERFTIHLTPRNPQRDLCFYLIEVWSTLMLQFVL